MARSKRGDVTEYCTMADDRDETDDSRALGSRASKMNMASRDRSLRLATDDEQSGSEGSFGGESSGSQSGSADANGSSISGGANAGQSSDGTSGQPIGGNDSNTGSGTTLTRERISAARAQAAKRRRAVAAATRSPATMTISAAAPEAISARQALGRHRRPAAAQACLEEQALSARRAADPTTICRKTSDSPSSARAIEGSDFAREGRGALDEGDDDRSTSGTDSGDGGGAA